MPAVDMAIIAVVAGDGLTDVFTSLGVTTIVPGGQTMNPSTNQASHHTHKSETS